jgi:hypothetical protein
VSIDPKKLKVVDDIPPRRGRIRSELTLAIVEVGEQAPDDGSWLSYPLDTDPAKMTQAIRSAVRHLPDDVHLEYRTADGQVTLFARREPF